MKTRDFPCKVTRIVDGDTFIALIDLGFYVSTEQRIRVAHVNAPERKKGEVCPAESFLTEEILGKDFTVTCYGKDRYGRWIGEVIIKGKYLSDIMLGKGIVDKYA